MPQHVIVLRNPGLPERPIPAAEVLAALPQEIQDVPRTDVEISTLKFEPRVNQGDWEGQAAELATAAAKLHASLHELGGAEVHYFGLAEIPHIVALGAFIGDEQSVVIHEFDRDAGSWRWPTDARTIELTTRGLPSGNPIPARGSAVLRVEISAPISDQDVHAAAGTNHLVETRVMLAGEAPTGICKVRSAADLHAVRLEIRQALAAIRAKCPNYEALHLFVAAPASLCFALGQELKPRNSAPVQTYRYRHVTGQNAYMPALELSATLGAEAEEPLTPQQTDTANHVREVWRTALKRVESFAASSGEQLEGKETCWYETLHPRETFRQVQPFPALPSVNHVVPLAASVDPSAVASEYGFTKPDKTWHLSDRLLLGFSQAVAGDDQGLERLIRLFLFHEYLHDYHSLTKYRAEGVGTFPNCLEFIDYTADVYALLHQLELQRQIDHSTVSTDEKQRSFLISQIQLVLDSFWAFERPGSIKEWQIRRLRRYLNWYWRLVQIQYAGNMLQVIRLFARAPHVELAGLHQYARGRRLYCRLDKLDATTELELAVVLENCKLLRASDSTSTNVKRLLVAFQNREDGEILKFFRSVYEEAREKGGPLPAL